MILIESRAVVIERQRAADRTARADAPLHITTPGRAAELRQIAHRHPGHIERVVAALRSGWTTAQDIEAHLDSLVPHARLTAIRNSGELMLDRWVKVHDAQGRERTLKAYRIVAGLDGEGGAK